METHISGALIEYIIPDSPPWAPHRSVSKADAIRALSIHLRRDCPITTDVFHEDANRISGNFFIASAGFCIEAPTADECASVQKMIGDYKNSEHFQIYKQACSIYRECEERVAAATEEAFRLGFERHRRDAGRWAIEKECRAKVRPLELRLEAIYRAGGIRQPATGA